MVERLDNVWQTVEEKVNEEFKDPTHFKGQCAEILTIAQSKSKLKNGEIFLKVAEKLNQTAQRLKGREQPTDALSQVLNEIKELKVKVAALEKGNQENSITSRKDRQKIA